MIPISQTVRTWKNSDARLDPLIYLVEVEVDDSTTLRLVQGNPIGADVTYDGETYTPAGIVREELEQSVDGEMGTFRLGISNVDGVAGGYIERYELEGRTVRLITVPRSTLDPADAAVETYSILDQAYDRQAATITLGPPVFWKRKVPWRRYQRSRCQWDWENRFADDNGCGYPSDRFGSDSAQDFVVGRTTDAVEAREWGWSTLNALKASIFDVDLTTPGVLTVASSSQAIDWSTVARGAPFLFKAITGDFAVEARVGIAASRAGFLAGILCQEAAGAGDSWILLGRGVDALGAVSVRATSALAGVGQSGLSADDDAPEFLKLSRVGDVFSAFYSTDGSTWTLLGTKTLAFDADVRLGLVLSALGAEAGTVEAVFDFFQFRAGGLATCERTLAACALHFNTRRILSFPGIPV